MTDTSAISSFWPYRHIIDKKNPVHRSLLCCQPVTLDVRRMLELEFQRPPSARTKPTNLD